MTMTVITTHNPVQVTPRPDVGELLELVESMNAATGRLQATHQALHGEVARLQEELAEANERLRRSRALAALGEMAAGIAHEIRNPLASIQLYVQVLGDDLRDRPDEHELCEKIGRSVEGLESVIRDVLAFARDHVVRRARIEPGVVIDKALDACVGLLVGSGIEIDRGPLDDDPLTADGVLLAQALGNIIRNAVEAMRETEGVKRLTLAVERRDERCPDGRREPRVVFIVRDTGPGIPPETVERMFNPFFTTRASGTGLGLAIVHRIVDAHGGHVRVRNQDDGGACIELCLPPGHTRQEGDT